MARILVVEDDREFRNVLEEALAGEGHEVAAVANGKQALRLTLEKKFDLVITDLIMPDGEGIETIVALRRVAPQTQIVAISGGGQGRPEGYLAIAAQVGAARTLAKPFTHGDLMESVSSLLTPQGSKADCV